jgi:hypothetical protein
MSGLRMSATWKPFQEAACGKERPVTSGDTSAATNLLLPFGFAVLQASSSAEDYIQDGKNPW